MLQFGLRLGEAAAGGDHHAAADQLIKELLADPRRGRPGWRPRNADNLAPSFSSEIEAALRGTRLGRQELDAEMLDDLPGALCRALIERRARRRRTWRVVVAVDPPGRRGRRRTRPGSSSPAWRRRPRLRAGRPDRRAAQARSVGARGDRRLSPFEADRIVAEINQGGDMVEATIRTVDAERAVQRRAGDARQVGARRAGGRALRAGPHGACRRASGARGPDVRSGPTARRAAKSRRVDALAWALTELTLKVRP